MIVSMSKNDKVSLSQYLIVLSYFIIVSTMIILTCTGNFNISNELKFLIYITSCVFFSSLLFHYKMVNKSTLIVIIIVLTVIGTLNMTNETKILIYIIVAILTLIAFFSHEIINKLKNQSNIKRDVNG